MFDLMIDRRMVSASTVAEASKIHKKNMELGSTLRPLLGFTRDLSLNK